MNDSKEDRRIRRTRGALNEALIALILEKPYEDITVEEITGWADVGRTTFYAHYDNKEDLFLSSWQSLLDHLAERTDWSKVGSPGFLPVPFLFNHAREFHPFFLALVESDKARVIFETGIPYLANRLEKGLPKHTLLDEGLPVPRHLVAFHLASGLLNLLRWWLQHGMPYQPSRMDEVYHELYMPAWLGESNRET